MKLVKRIFATIVLTYLLIGCAPKVAFKDLSFREGFDKAYQSYSKEKYVKAVEEFDILSQNFSGQAGIDTVQYYLASAHFMLEEYYKASYEFNRLNTIYPDSYLAEEAMFKAAISYYHLSPYSTLDQNETVLAIDKLQGYLEKYKAGKYVAEANTKILELRNKLAKKEFESALLYIKMDQPRAAKVYLTLLVENYYDTDYYLPALKELSMAYRQMEDSYNADVYQKKYLELSGKKE